MDFDFNKIKEMGLEYAEKGKNAALDLAEKGRTQAKIVNAQSKLYKAQRQLGALVYSLHKAGEENPALVEKYIDAVAEVEKAIEEIKAVDRSRKNYHNYYCETKWGDARGYDMTVKSDVLGFEGTAKMLIAYIRSFMEQD